MDFRGLTIEEVQLAWDALRKFVKAGLDATSAKLDYSPEDILSDIESRDVQAWAVFQNDSVMALVLTRIVVYPRRKVLEMFLASGVGLLSWANGVYDVMVAFGKTNGCSGMRAYGREGWEKMLRAHAPTIKTFVAEVEI